MNINIDNHLVRSSSYNFLPILLTVNIPTSKKFKTLFGKNIYIPFKMNNYGSSRTNLDTNISFRNGQIELLYISIILLPITYFLYF